MMNFEFEEFNSPEDIFVYMSTIAPPMKNMLPINSYKGYIFSLIPLNPTTGDMYLLIYTKGKLDGKMLEFDMNSKKYRAVEIAERTDKNYFVVLTPKRNTIADAAIKELEKNLIKEIRGKKQEIDGYQSMNIEQRRSLYNRCWTCRSIPLSFRSTTSRKVLPPCMTVSRRSWRPPERVLSWFLWTMAVWTAPTSCCVK